MGFVNYYAAITEVVEEVSRHGEIFNTGVTFKDLLLWVPVLLGGIAAVMQARKATKKMNEVKEEVKTGNGKTAGEYLPHISEQLTEIQIQMARMDERNQSDLRGIHTCIEEHKEQASEAMGVISNALANHLPLTEQERFELHHVSKKLREELD